MANQNKDFKMIQNHLKEMGFIFQGSQIYGGLANTWDYGPLGISLIQNIKTSWWTEFIQNEPANFGLDSKILMNSEVWKASGHLNNFVDFLIENKNNKKRYRADHIVQSLFPKINPDQMSKQELETFIKQNVPTYDGAKTDWNTIREFQLMFATKQGVVADSTADVFLRPETAQGIFINFKNVMRSMRAKIPFGIGQIGKAFRNEITPGNYTFRTREFEQMELEYFVQPKQDQKAFAYYVQKSHDWLLKLGLKPNSMRLKKHDDKVLAHYAKATTDIEFSYPFGWGELMGISNRGDFDLKAHMQASKESLEYLDPLSNKKYFPYVIEPSIGVDRLMLAILVDAFTIEKQGDETRTILKLPSHLAPYQVAVLPLNKKHHATSATKVFQALKKQNIAVTYDETGSIGKRYRRQDAIGTPLVITVIDQTETTKKVTIRFRDSMKQENITWDQIRKYF